MSRKKPGPVRRLIGTLFRLLLMLLLLALTACAAVGAYIMATAPEISIADVSPQGYRTTVLDSAGEEVLILAAEESNRVYVGLNQIPKNLQNAFIAIEDERFYQHHGVDFVGIARALVKNAVSGTLSQGASTITQQLIKNNIFEVGVNEETATDKIKRKLQEQYLAWRLEQNASKGWILENYLNTINLGAGTWGVQTAAQRYFGKDVSELTLAECAAIAAITRNPTAYNPLNYPEKNQERQRLVLSHMLELEFITQSAYQAALSEDIYTNMAEKAGEGGIPVFSYFEDAALTQVVRDLVKLRGCTEYEAWQSVYRDGLTIETTRDSALQSICEKAINQGDADAQATAVMIDCNSGAVRAIVGGRGEKTASLTLNRAISAVRQPGSTFKIVGEYAEALETGSITLGMAFDDAPTSYSDGTPIRNATGEYGGKTTVREAITVSLNTVALRCFKRVGLDAVWKRLEKFGFQHLDEQDRVEALALGGTHGGVTNLELTAAYAAIANGGMYHEPCYYTRVLDRYGNIILQRIPLQWEAVSVYTAALLTSALEDVIDNGTGTEAYFEGQRLAGKSGTTTERRDLWFVGFSPYYACGVWSGYDDFSLQTESNAYVQKIWRSIMEQAHTSLPERNFNRPDGMERAVICEKCGNLAAEGLCDQTVQGDMTWTELFAPGTAPKESCTCHVRVEICPESGQIAGEYCPWRESRVYLRTGTEESADAAAVVPAESCQIHSSWEDSFDPSEEFDWPWEGRESGETENGETGEYPTPTPEQEEIPDTRRRREWWTWWDWF